MGWEYIIGILLGIGFIVYAMKSNKTNKTKSISNPGTEQINIESVINVDELKKNIMDALDKINQAWLECFEEAEKNGVVDNKQVFSKYSKIVSEIDQKFIDAKIRVEKNKKKRGFFK